MATVDTIDHRFLMPLEKALERLTGLALPHGVRQQLVSSFVELEEGQGRGVTSIEITGRQVTLEELEQIMRMGNNGTFRVTPAGAAPLLELYRAGSFR